MLGSLVDRARRFRALLAQLGPGYGAIAPLWLLAGGATRTFGRTAQTLEARMLRIEGARGILGPAHRAYSGHSAEENREIWTTWDWSQGGNEWNDSDDPELWKASLIEEVLLPHLGDAHAVLEIGPGAGRWSEVLQPRVERLVVVDVTPLALELTRDNLGDPANVEYVLSEGGLFAEVQAASIDWVWSFDVFVHIAPLDVASYLGEIARVLRPGGTAVIHHSGGLGRQPGWRSPMTGVLFAQLAQERGLQVTRQFDSWSDGRFGVRTNNDVITVLLCPTA
jgi:ubiquinone/menaquinone biosynthesis C-methylase UbiE